MGIGLEAVGHPEFAWHLAFWAPEPIERLRQAVVKLHSWWSTMAGEAH